MRLFRVWYLLVGLMCAIHLCESRRPPQLMATFVSKPSGIGHFSTMKTKSSNDGHQADNINRSRRSFLKKTVVLDHDSSPADTKTNKQSKQQQRLSLGRVVSFPTITSDDDTENQCDCCSNSNNALSPRMARIVMPVRSFLTSQILPSPVNAVMSNREKSNEENSFQASVNRHFPQSEPSSRIVSLVSKELRSRNYNPSNTLFGTSICPDEINSKPSKSLSTALQHSLSNQNGVFALGGLAGLPFVGVSGMKAFLSHCPEEGGKVVILFGPHVGISDQGTVGKVERLGQGNHPSSSCGATLGAYRAVRNKNAGAPKRSGGIIDYQEDYIVSKLRPILSKTKANLGEDEAITFVTTQMYNLVVEMLMDELQACWKGNMDFWKNIGEVTLLGGIVINRGEAKPSRKDRSREDFFQPLLFETWSKPQDGDSPKGTTSPPVREDLYRNTFGADPPAQITL